MKKSVVAVGVIVALGVVWTGASWFTGKQLEGRLAEMVAQANGEIKRSAPEAGLELSYQNYQRGVFTSRMQVVVKPVAGTENGWLKPGQSVVLDEVVSHGPLPLAQLKSFNLIPSMASVHTVLVNNDVTKPLFDLAKNESPFDINTRISYAGDTSSDIALKALNYEKENEKVAFSGGHFKLDADRDGNVFSLTGEAESGLVNAVNEYNQKVQLTFSNLKADGNSRMTDFQERIGDQKLSLDKVAIAVEGKEMAVLEGMDVNGKSDVSKDGKSINTQLDYTLKSLKVQNQDLGTGKLSLKIGNIDGQAWHEFSQKYSKESQALLTDAALQQNPEVYQQQAMAVLFNNLRTDTGEIVQTRDELAELIGDTPDHVSQIMGELGSIGAISRRREKVAGMRGPGLVRYFMNPKVGTHLTGAARDKAQAGSAPLLALIEGGRS